MKRQKRILAGAAAMLLALGMLISCDTPANNGSSDGGSVGGDIQNPDDSNGDEDNSDGGSVGGDITLPAGDPEAESELVGTWVNTNYEYDFYTFSNGGTFKVGSGTGTWSATETDLSTRSKISEDTIPSYEALVTGDILTLTSIEDIWVTTFSREKGSGDSLEGTWRSSDEENDIFLEINTNSCTMKFTDSIGPAKSEREYTGSREDNTLIMKEGVQMLTTPYTLSEDGNTLKLIFDTEYSSTYTRQ